MNWTDYLVGEVNEAYNATQGLLNLVEADTINWKPTSGDNWMTTGQLLAHIPTACGFCMRGLVTGDWSMPDGSSLEEMAPEDMLPAAEKMPSVETVAQAREALAADQQLALQMIAEAGEDDLSAKMVQAPWAPTEQLLGKQLADMVGHLSSHKSQLYYYLKLQGKPVNTGHLWGMPAQ